MAKKTAVKSSKKASPKKRPKTRKPASKHPLLKKIGKVAEQIAGVVIYEVLKNVLLGMTGLSAVALDDRLEDHLHINSTAARAALAQELNLRYSLAGHPLSPSLHPTDILDCVTVGQLYNVILKHTRD
jgi:hypothetical protein